MSQYTPATVREIVDWIAEGKLILPAMQRNFVWPAQKICDLFDSLASEYPIGTFLFWTVDRNKTRELVFNSFVNTYDESNPIQRGNPIVPNLSEYSAVLDGQQRITAFNIGISGRMHLRKQKYSKQFVDKYLALDVFHNPHADADALNHYSFSFREAEELEKLPIDETGLINYQGNCWIPVSKIAANGFDENEVIDELENQAIIEKDVRIAMRKQMKQVARSIKDIQAVSFYPARNKDLREVVEIFVRVNSGGEKLSASDLMLSIASGNTDKDVQRQISEAIELIRQTPNSDIVFPADKELIIRAGLMFTGAKSLALTNKDNYSKTQLETIFTDKWDDIVEALCNGVRLIDWLGFNVANISKNLLLPIAYYLYLKMPSNGYYTTNSGDGSVDKILIKQWLIRAIVRSIFRDGTGSTLIYCRDVINANGTKHFPLGVFLEENAARNLRIGEESISDILRLKFGDSVVRPLLAVLSKKVDVSYMTVDHMWPQDILSSKQKTRKNYPNISEEEYSAFKSRMHNIANLQLLGQADNSSKNNMLFDQWVANNYNEATLPAYQQSACVDPDAPITFASFIEFTDRRLKVIEQRLREEFPDDIEERLLNH